MWKIAAAIGLALVIAWPGLPASAVAHPAGEHAIARVADHTERAVAMAARLAGATDVVVLEMLDLVTFRSSSAARQRLASHPDVRSVALDRPIAVADRGDEDDDENGKGDSPGAAVILGRSSDDDDDDDDRRSGNTGRGVTVAVLDTGIAPHGDLKRRVLARVDLVGDGARSLDPAGHGTYVAGLIAGSRSGAGSGGLAPDADLVDVRVLDAEGRGSVRKAVEAFDWVLKNRARYGIRVVSISWGAPAVVSYHEDPLAAAVEAAWLAGITVVVSAGNDGPSGGTVTSPGSDPFVITVGSLEDAGTMSRADDTPSGFSAVGPTADGFAKPDVLAPGRKVISLRSKGSTLEKARPDRIVTRAHMRLSGTSAAAALVSGTAAVLIQNGARSPAEVKGKLVAGGVPVAGSSAPSVDLRGALAASGIANASLEPSRLLMRTLSASGQVQGDNVTWEGITWEGITWEGITWEGLTWEGITWENISWEHAPH